MFKKKLIKLCVGVCVYVCVIRITETRCVTQKRRGEERLERGAEKRGEGTQLSLHLLLSSLP